MPHYDKNLPYLSHLQSSLLSKSSFVEDGIILLRNSTETYLGFKPWGTGNSLVIKTVNKAEMPFFRIYGMSGNAPTGFESQQLNYRGKYISIIVGNAMKSSNNSQISFVFSVKGIHRNYYLIFVHGSLSIEGWRGNKYFAHVNSFSSRLINLERLIGSDYYAVEKVAIVVQKQTSLNPMEFRIDLNKSTANPPLRLPGEQYLVFGNVSQDGIVTGERNIIHNLGFSKMIDVEFLGLSKNDKIIGNGWHITNIKKWIDPRLGSENIILIAEQSVTSPQPLSSTVSKLDITQSLLNLGSADYLFLVIVVASLSLSWILYKQRFKIAV